MRIAGILLLIICFSCHQSPETKPLAIEGKKDSILISQKTPVNSDTLKGGKSIMLEKHSGKKNKSAKSKIRYERMGSYPTDDNFNGQPLLEQCDIPSNILKSVPDTLLKLAKAYYLNFERLFPRSIADNFETGVSTEHITYPKLIFQFELFENEFAEKAYYVKSISIIKDINGKLVVE
ncbi:MAG: hypothetical protein WCH34_02495 [Bacteroidota bacterium]